MSASYRGARHGPGLFERDVLVEIREELKVLALLLAGERRGQRPRLSFGELAAKWLARISKRRVRPSYEAGHLKHLAALSEMCEGELTPGAIDTLFGVLARPHGHLAPASINKLRSTGRLVIRDAQANGEWTGPNPFDLVRRLREPRRLYSTLTLPEVRRVLAHLRPDRRRLVKTCLLVGLRPGEALGLKRADVDVKRKTLRVRRSHGRDQTKTGREREFPIPDELVPDLVEALAEAPGEWVFPKADGTRQREDTKLSRCIQAALVAAGVVVGYRYVCRRKGCGHEQLEEERLALAPPCPKCRMVLWCSPVPKPFRFYDLRHSAASLHAMAKCDPMVIRELLGHAPKNITEQTYIHLDEDYRRAELNKLKL